MGLGFDMKWARIPRSFGPTIAPQNLLPGSLDGEEDFDILEPISWPVEFCSPMGARAFLLLAFRRTRCTLINTFMRLRGLLRYTECVFNDAFMKQRGFGS